MSEKVWARWPFAYNGVDMDRGQVFEFTGQINDEKLLRLGYAAKVSKSLKTQAQCGECGAWFLDDGLRDTHGHVRHKNRRRESDLEFVAAGKANEQGEPEVFEDRSGDKLERHLMQAAPLYLDKTRASQRG